MTLNATEESTEVEGANELFDVSAWEPWPWHRLLLKVLTHQFAPENVKEIWASEFYKDKACLSATDSHPASKDVGINSTEEYDRIIRQAVDDSQWILPSEKEEFARDLVLGNEDATISVLLPLLPNIRCVRPPYEAELTGRMFRRVSNAYANTNNRTELPFQQLILLVTYSENGEFAFPLSWIQDYISIPSLKGVILMNAFDTEFEGWRDDVPRPTCPDICIWEGGVSADIIKQFAAGWAAPCVIREKWRNPNIYGISGPEHPEWTVCRVTDSNTVSNNSNTGHHRQLRVELEIEDPLHCEEEEFVSWEERYRSNPYFGWNTVA